jgi:hypothetical protein
MGANFHPHLHGLVSKGAFDAHGVFYALPWIDTHKMALLFRDKVFFMLIREGKILYSESSRYYPYLIVSSSSSEGGSGGD